jgi:hypothetical protein
MSGIFLENLGAFWASDLETASCNTRLGLHQGSTTGDADNVQSAPFSDNSFIAK